jgi:hypothetical protein
MMVGGALAVLFDRSTARTANRMLPSRIASLLQGSSCSAYYGDVK